MLALTFVSGCVDAVSFLGLGQVFLANMTGNVALMGFAVAGDGAGQGLRAATSLSCFTVGALVGGRVSRPLPPGVPWAGSVDRLLALQLLLLATAAGLLAVAGPEAGSMSSTPSSDWSPRRWDCRERRPAVSLSPTCRPP